ncbi:hypothetical protein ACFWU5_26200 [Nocardia sp. NPDC058640]|uniref:hypothetical protein n=1 Tax=Nocardia sp. NPDC058640 TaxID=3346571 RepID=UPI00365F64E4
MSDEVYGDWAAVARDQMDYSVFRERNPGFEDRVYSQYLEVLKSRMLTCDDMFGLAGVDFGSDDEMYLFLEEAFSEMFATKPSS